ncbi:MAG TPA: hypothetical protein VHM72_06955 [Solirubrobacteraceae bacterium]|nr:hypothetical protein [Solirubrobacteraceae bacterium]
MAVVAEPVHAPPAATAAPRRAIQIVPLQGLPVVALVLVGMVVAIATNSPWALDFYHVVGGGLWTAIDLFFGLVLGPIMGTLSIPARVELASRLMPKMLLIMPTLVTMTLGAGFQLARSLGNLAANSPTHSWLVASYIVVGVMATIALGLLEPANIAVLFELRKAQPNGPRIERLMKVFIYTAGITGLMQIATLVIMTHLAAG